MKKMLKYLLWVSIPILIFLLLDRISYYSNPSYTNSKNAKLVRLRMDSLKVLKIMGKPDKINKTSYYKEYFYFPREGSSYGINFYFDPKGILREINTEDSILYDNEYKEESIVRGEWVVDSVVSKKAGTKFGYEKPW